jgi:hypothetical protein
MDVLLQPWNHSIPPAAKGYDAGHMPASAGEVAEEMHFGKTQKSGIIFL